MESNIEELQQSIEEHQAELKTDMHTHLLPEERQELTDLTPRLKQLQVCWIMPAEASTDGSKGLLPDVADLQASVQVCARTCAAFLHA